MIELTDLWSYSMGAMATLGCLAGGTWTLAMKSQSPRQLPVQNEPERPFERISLDGCAKLQGWFVWGKGNTPAKRAPVIIICHGWGSNRERVLRYAYPLADAGFNLLLYDVSSHGDSGVVKTPSPLLFRDDLLASVRYVRTRSDVEPERIGVLGHSLGGFGAVMALDCGLDVQALVTDSMPARPLTLVAAELRRWRLPSFPLATVIPRIWLYRSQIPLAVYEDLDLARSLSNNEARTKGRVPVLMVHSRGDGFIPAGELEGILARLAFPQQHVFVDSPGHSCSEQDPRFWPEVLPFFHWHLGLTAEMPCSCPERASAARQTLFT